MARRWSEMAAAAASRGIRRNRRYKSAERRRAPFPHAVSPGAILALAYPERIAKGRGGAAGGYLMANGRGSDAGRASPLAREPYLAVAEVVGTAAQGRDHARGGDHAGPRSRCASPNASRCAKRSPAIPKARRCRAERRDGSALVTLSEQPFAGHTERRHRRCDLPSRSRARASTGCLGRRPLRQWRDRVMFLRRAEGEEWPDLSERGSRQRRRLARAVLAEKTALATLSASELESALLALLPHRLRRRLETRRPRISKRLPARGCPSITDRKKAPSSPFACRNCSAWTAIPRLPAGACRW